MLTATFYANPTTGETYAKAREFDGELCFTPLGIAGWSGPPPPDNMFAVREYRAGFGWASWAARVLTWDLRVSAPKHATRAQVLTEALAVLALETSQPQEPLEIDDWERDD